MKVDEFIEKLKEILELQDVELCEETNLRDLEEYDSLAVLSIIAMVDENFGRKLTGQNFQSITTVRSLIKLIGDKYFE